MFETEVSEGVLRAGREGAQWLSTGWDGGRWTAGAAYNVSVPEGFERDDLDAYLAERLADAGFDESGPALLTGVDLEHARGARLEPVAAVATAGVSNPAALPMDPAGEYADATGEYAGTSGENADVTGEGPNAVGEDADAASHGAASAPDVGTVNVLVGTGRSLAPGALANLLAVTVEAKTATLLAETGFPGTTTDAAIVGCDPAGEEVAFTGSATEVGAAARACVREAVRASLDSRYGDGTDATIPGSVVDADHGVVTDRRAEVFDP